MQNLDWRSRRRGTGKRYVKITEHSKQEQYEHRAVAERAMGKPLPAKAEIHHVDGNKKNNAQRNLVICQDRAYHALLHARARVRALGGDPNTEACCTKCRLLRPHSDFYVRKRPKHVGGRTGTRTNVCRSCVAVMRTAWHAARKAERMVQACR